MSAVEVEDLSIHYGSFTAVDHVSFAAEFGEVTAVLGPNGAGKTSTIETCEGFRRPSSGRVQVLGLDPEAERTKVHSEVGVMLQEGGVYPSARVRETIVQYCSLYNRGVEPDVLLSAVNLEDKANSPWRRLSGGEKQRLLLALALAARPRVAFLDEPTSGVDINGRDAIRHIITDLASQGTAVVLATHELDEAERLAHRVILFNKGRIIANGALDTLRSARNEVRFVSDASLDVVALEIHVGLPVIASGTSFTIAFDADDPSLAAELVSRVSLWLGTQNLALRDLSVGAQRLEDLFRELTGGDQ